jgi:hypothetical protein
MLAGLLNNAKHWRERAEEAHVHADQLTDPEAKHIMHGIIKSYLRLARSAKERQLSAGLTRRVHSRYVREVSDLPCSGRSVRLRVVTRRFCCDTSHCRRRIFHSNALHTLFHQRHLTPSCGGRAPTAERTLNPARMIKRELDPRPGIREQAGPIADNCLPEHTFISGAGARPQASRCSSVRRR